MSDVEFSRDTLVSYFQLKCVLWILQQTNKQSVNTMKKDQNAE